MVYQNFEEIFVRVLDAQAQRKTKVLCGNNRPYVDKNLSKAIIKNSPLKRKASQIKQQEEITKKYKKQPNLVIKLNRGMKLQYLNSLKTL